LDWYLLAVDWAQLGDIAAFVWHILLVVIGLGMVIFVHELGHFAVAKLCGVKCEKFYLGFDIGGLKLFSLKYGETEYGIGILPLGGYVKMLGQEDNPSKIREEVERAKAQAAQAKLAADDASASGDSLPAEDDSSEENPPPAFDPRSYLAQSVPKRMAIISAGVIMNVLFAVVMGTLAYMLGVFQVECGVGGLAAGSGAWTADLEVGDRIVAINGKPVKRFDDLKAAMSVGDVDSGVPLMVERPNKPEPFAVTVYPNATKPVPTIGVLPPRTAEILKEVPVFPRTAAERAFKEKKLLDKDGKLVGTARVTAIDGKPVSGYPDIVRQLALAPDKPLTLSLQRTLPPPADDKKAPPKVEQLDVVVPPEPRKVAEFGMVLELGPIAAVQARSPAAAAGLQAGDQITLVDGAPVGDPMTLPDRLRERGAKGDKVQLTIRRGGSEQVIEVPLRRVETFTYVVSERESLDVEALGIACRVSPRVNDVRPDSLAAAVGLRGGEAIVAAQILLPEPETIEDPELRAAVEKAETDELDLVKSPNAWPFLQESLQRAVPGSYLCLRLEDGRTMTAPIVAASNRFDPNRGVSFDFLGSQVTADSFGEALKMGTDDTVGSMSLVFQFLRRIGSRSRAMGGPVTIAKVAYYSAAQGPGELALFLMLISANLAVINFLPIPVLDGGHMVFLAYEGITGKPPDERIHLLLSYLGLFLILGLMIWVLGLDLKLISRH
jgi:regulator of sigma E protease